MELLLTDKGTFSVRLCTLPRNVPSKKEKRGLRDHFHEHMGHVPKVKK